MAMTAQSMMTRVQRYVSAVPPPTAADPASAQAYQQAVLTAMCQGIIEEIQMAAQIQGNDTVTGALVTGAPGQAIK